MKKDTTQLRFSEVIRVQSQDTNVLGFRNLSFTSYKSCGSSSSCLLRMGPAGVIHAFSDEERCIEETVVTDLC